MKNVEGMSAQQIISFLKLKEHRIYKVKVKLTSINVEHFCFLFIGFKHGSYCELYNNSYDSPHDLRNGIYSIEIIKDLGNIK